MPVTTPGSSTASSIVDLIGNTPMIRLSGFEAGLRNVQLYAKAEWKNPGGSVKDRPAARMILDGEHAGALTRDKIILDATSGNTGIAYAMIGAARGYRVRLCVPENVTPERKRILKAFGADIVFTDPMDGSDGAAKKRPRPLRSRITTQGLDRTPHRAFLRGMGLSDEDIGKPFIGVMSTHGEVTPCSMTLGPQAEQAKAGEP